MCRAALLLVLMGCPRTPPAPPSAEVAPPPKAELPCPGLDPALAALLLGEPSPLPRDEAGRVRVVAEVEPPDLALPLLAEELRARGLVQGWIAPADLCALAATDGVRAVRPPHLVTPPEPDGDGAP